jgi:hypothetical protein
VLVNHCFNFQNFLFHISGPFDNGLNSLYELFFGDLSIFAFVKNYIHPHYHAISHLLGELFNLAVIL